MENELMDWLEELTEPRRVVEFEDAEGRGIGKGLHQHVLPSLLDALAAAVEPGGDNGQAEGGKSFESRPAARLSPIVVLRQLDEFGRRWCTVFGLRRASIRGHLLAVKGQVPGCSDHDLQRLAGELEPLWQVAREVTGWDDPPAPMRGAACPFCGRESLMWNRRDADFRAWCSNAQCRAAGEESGMPRSWDNDTLPVLREMLRVSREQEKLAAP